ncbi:MAG: cupin domain-containing protein [Methylotenera sp.]|nr:cupin domain-containing protein [Methylotenera sp.]
MTKNASLPLLGNLTPTQFLVEYWQKKPLLIKNAIAGFTGFLSPEELAGLACEEEVQSRIVQHKHGKWSLKNGPFDEQEFSKLPKKNWTLLVQSVNHYLPEASELLQQFDFIPHARLDDLMVSYAPDGGGVGPHFDSYDVFLLQGQGKRLWQMSEQRDLSLVEDAPLRILKNFEAEQEWLLEPGDILYLPPQVAHWGIAVSDGSEDCMTYSIGFRAPKHQELASEFLGFMQDRLAQEKLVLTGMYQDSNLKLADHPAEISKDMVHKVGEILSKIQWSEDDITEFLGQYLSEPKPDIVFEANKKLSLKVFNDKLGKIGIALDLKSQMLFSGDTFYLNGEAASFNVETGNVLRTLSDNRKILPHRIEDPVLLQQLYDWYIAGYLYFEG